MKNTPKSPNLIDRQAACVGLLCWLVVVFVAVAVPAITIPVAILLGTAGAQLLSIAFEWPSRGQRGARP